LKNITNRVKNGSRLEKKEKFRRSGPKKKKECRDT